MEALGINLVSIIIYTLLFIVLYLLLDKYFLKKIFAALEVRQQELDKGFKYSQEAEKKLEDVEKDAQTMLDKAKSEAHDIRENTLKESDIEKKQIIERAKLEAAEIIEKANTRFDEYKKQYESKINAEINEKATELVKRLIGDRKELDKALIDKYISKI